MNKVFVNRRLVIHTLLAPFFVIFPIFVTCVVFGNIILALIFTSVFYAIMLGILLIFRHNAFMRVEINTIGIKNRFLCFTWQEIDELGGYQIYRIILYKHNLLKPIHLPSVIGVGENGKGAFYFQNPRKTLMFSLDNKTLSLIEQFGKQSTVIKEILEKYCAS